MADDLRPAGDAVTSGDAGASGEAAGADGRTSVSGSLSGPMPASSLGNLPKAGGLGGIIGAILRGLAPSVRRVRRRTSRVTRRRTDRRSGSATADTRGTLLQLRYHAGSAGTWQTARVASGRRGNRIAVISSSDASWWRHIRSGSPVQVRVRNRWVDGRARLLARDEDTYARAVGIFIEDRSRAAAQRLGVPMDEHGRLVHGERRPGDAVVVWIEVEGD